MWCRRPLHVVTKPTALSADIPSARICVLSIRVASLSVFRVARDAACASSESRSPSIEFVVLVVLGSSGSQFEGQPRVGEMVEPYSRGHRDRSLVCGAFVACLRGGSCLPTKLPSRVDEVVQRLVVLEYPDQLELVHADPQARLDFRHLHV